MPKEYALRVWAGDPGTVAEARRKYLCDPRGHLMDYAVALYSFRYFPWVAEELDGIHERLLGRANALLDDALRIPPPKRNLVELANETETLSAHLEYLSRRRRLKNDRWVLRHTALDVCKLGLKLCAETPLPESNNHTLLFLEITELNLYLLSRSRSRQYVRRWARVITYSAISVPDPNQRARIYRKIGMLYRKAWAPLRAYYWLGKSCSVPGIPLAVRLKSFAALIGIDL